MQIIRETLTAVTAANPVDTIIQQLKQLIVSGQLRPGDRLPAERILSERFAVGRSYVREAILKLEFYGLLKTTPQSGTYVAGLSIKVIDNLITDIIKFNKDDFGALIEARYHLELNAVKLAAARRTDEDLQSIEQAMLEYEAKTLSGQSAVEDDMLFHVMIARASHNSVIESMILILIPDLIKTITENKICGENRGKLAIDEHRAIFAALQAGDSTAAESALASHLDEILQVSLADHQFKEIINQHKPGNF
jgi:GntR family transcriptional repressor for pyruvate dehydrogenase complex